MLPDDAAVRSVTDLPDIMDLFAGDAIATETLGGVAMRVPKRHGIRRPWEASACVRSTRASQTQTQKFARFVEAQARSGRYLMPGDHVRINIASADGSIDLGWQENEVVALDSSSAVSVII